MVTTTISSLNPPQADKNPPTNLTSTPRQGIKEICKKILDTGFIADIMILYCLRFTTYG